MKKLVFLVIIALFFTCCKEEEKVEKPIRIALICDVHYGITWSENSVTRVTKAVNLINKLMPDVVLIAGDNVHYPCHEVGTKEFLSHIKKIDVPVLFAPGNHELEIPVTMEGLECYRSYYGDDFVTMECKKHTIIAANSVLWDNSGAPQEIIDLHDKKLDDALKEAQRKKQPVILLTHIPPWGYYGEKFYRILPEKFEPYFAKNGVSFWLAGHTHQHLQRTYESMNIFTGETLSVNGDELPLGFRLLTIYPDHSFDWDFIPLNK